MIQVNFLLLTLLWSRLYPLKSIICCQSTNRKFFWAGLVHPTLSKAQGNETSRKTSMKDWSADKPPHSAICGMEVMPFRVSWSKLGRDVQMRISHVWGVSRQYLLMSWKTPQIQEKMGCQFCFPHFHDVQLTYTVWHGLMGLGESAGRWLLTRVLQTFISLSGGKKAATDPISPQTTVQQWGHINTLPPSLKHGD